MTRRSNPPATRSRWRRLLPMVVLAVAAGGWIAIAAPPETPIPEGSSFRGQQTYKLYCSMCHGDEGSGNGKVAPSLRTHPADLTTIRSRSKGTFPVAKVFASIDEGRNLRGNENEDMPKWGECFARGRDERTPEEVRQVVADLVSHVATLQR